MVVSLDPRGYVFTGAGTTISRGVTAVDSREAKDMRVCTWDENLIFAGIEGVLAGYEISEDDISINNAFYDLPTVNGKARTVHELYKFGDALVVIGSGRILSIVVKVTEKKDGDKVSFDISWDPKTDSEIIIDETAPDPTNVYPHCDTLFDQSRDDMLACTYENGENVMVMYAVMDKSTKKWTVMDRVSYGIRRQYHGLAGLGPEGFVVANVGSRYNETEITGGVGPVKLKYVHVHDGKLEVNENFTTLPTEMSYGWFSLDNMHQNGAVLCYTRLASMGINCVSIDVMYGREGGQVQFGSTLVVSSGGAQVDTERTKLQMINEKTFAIMWCDNNIGGLVSYQMITFNDAGDLSRNGPAYVISHRMREDTILGHYVGCSGVDQYKSAVVELVQTNLKSIAVLHTVYVYPRPIGIAAKSFTGGNQVQFGGLWKVGQKAHSTALIPGHMYYTNDRGMILDGGPAGYMHRSFGIFYVTSRDDDSLLSLNNQVGMAISETELLLKFM